MSSIDHAYAQLSKIIGVLSRADEKEVVVRMNL